MAGDKTYITDSQGKQHRATRVHAVTPTDIVWSSNPNDYTVQVKIDGKWHRAVLTMDAGSSTFFDNINIDKALVTGADGKQHTALIVKPESTVTLSDIKTDTHGTIAGTTTGETAVSTYSENWSNVKWQDNVNVYKVLVTGSDGKVHTALLTTSAGGGVQVIVLGTSPLLLPDAIADSLQYVKAFGGTEQRNLPDGYIERQFIYMMDGSYLLTNIVPTYDCKVEMDFQTTTLPSASVYFFGGRTETYGGLFFARTVNTGFIVDAFGARYNSNISVSNNTRYKFTYDNQVAKVESAGTTLFTNTFTGTGETGAAFCINGLNTSGAITTTNTGIYLYSFKVWNAQGELVADYVPAIQKGTVPVVGFYDTVSKTFKTATTGTFAAGGEAVPTPDAPMDIVSNNGALKYSNNLLDMAAENIVLGKYINNSGVITDSPTNFYNGKYMPVVAGETYTWSTSSSIGYFSVMEYNSNYVFTKRTLFSNAGTSGSITLRSDTAFVLIGSNIDGTEVTLNKVAAIDWQFEKGSSATAYKPYSPTGVYTDGTVETIEDTIGNTATAEMLLKVGDYQDVQEILSGDVTKNVGIKVLDGTEEDLAFNTQYNVAYFYIQDKKIGGTDYTPLLCTHLRNNNVAYTVMGYGEIASTIRDNGINMRVSSNITSLALFKQYLADQYAAGTPVIVIYPLATATTESVTGQTLQVQAGNNTLEITQASLTGLELEAEYTKVA